MPVNETLSHYSDLCYTTATAIYMFAMVFFLIEQSFGRAGRQAAQRQQVLAGSGGPDVTEPPASQPRRSGRPERFGRMGAALVVLGVLLHTASVTLRGFATDRAPMGNMYEYVSALCLIAVATWLVIIRKYPIRHLSAFVLLPVVILMFVGGTALYTTAAPVQPALQSYWLVVHVTAAIVASGVLLVPGVASVLYLLRSVHEGNPERFTRLAAHLPSLDLLDRVAYRTTVLAFPVYTFGVLCGAIWAEAAWGRFWGWDPKETVAFIAWVIYAAYLHSRATAGWRGRRAAIINSMGFAFIVFNLFFVNLVTVGLHSYAGVG